MPIVSKPIRTKTARTSHEYVNIIGPGPYLAKVVGHLDKQFMGALKVQLLKSSSSGDDEDREGQVKIVSYASPFYGVTPVYSATGQDQYRNTQQSYGFWAVPPDVGSLVLVIFVEGRDDSGYWFACVQDEYMNFMVPDGRPATANTSPATPQYLKGKKLPVGEYNKNLTNPNGQNQPTYYARPYNNDFVRQLEEQGLLDDDIRGVTSSSARRETPSSVFGMNTPGPLDKRPGAPKIPKGTQETQANMFSSRLGGHSVVMDDGDDKILRKGPAINTPAEYANKDNNEPGGDPTLPANELFRIRTRTGHQILLHNTEDLIYIGNSRGTAWIEITANGKIDVFAQDSVSIHSNEDLNFTADRDINFTAFENMNVVVGNEFKQDVGSSTSLTTGTFYTLNAGESISNNAASFISHYAKTNFTAIAKTGMNLLSDDTLNIGSTSEVAIEGCTFVKIATDGDFHVKALGEMYINADNDINILSGTSYFLSAKQINETAENEIYRKASEINDLSSSSHTIGSNATFVDSPLNVKNNIITPQTIKGSRVQASTNVETPLIIRDSTSSGASVSSPTYSGGAPASAAAAIAAELPVQPEPVIPTEPLRAAQTARVPRHEPWYQHENLNPAAYTPSRTRAGNEQVDSFPAPRTPGGTGVLPDTYLPPTRQHQSGTINAAYFPQFDATTGSAETYKNRTWDSATDPTRHSYRGTPGEPVPISKVPKPIDGFTIEETTALLGALGYKESTNNYRAGPNPSGFVGKYQFGAQRLEDLGYIKAGTFQNTPVRPKNNVLLDPNYWTGKDGITSLDAFFDATNVQEKIMIDSANLSLKRLKQYGVILQGDDKATIMGLITAAHLVGECGCKWFRYPNLLETDVCFNAKKLADANGTVPAEYFGIGKSAYLSVSGASSTAAV